MISPCHLSPQSILCLHHGGVPDEIFFKLSRDTMQDTAEALTSWRNLGHDIRVTAKALEVLGSLTSARLQRIAGSSARAHGLAGRFTNVKAAITDSVAAEQDDESAIDKDAMDPKIVGAPKSVFESALQMIMAGFHPSVRKLNVSISCG